MLNILEDLITYGPVIISALSFFSLMINSWKKDEAGIALSYFMLFGSLFFTIDIIHNSGNLFIYNYLHVLFLAILLISCPLLYMYFYKLTIYKGSGKSWILHFIPSFFVLFFGSLFYFRLNYSQRIYFLENQLYQSSKDNPYNLFLFLFLSFFKYIFYAQIIFYYIKVRILLFKHRKALNEVFSDYSGYELNWVSFYFRFLAIWAIVAVISNAYLTNRVHSFRIFNLIVNLFQIIFIGGLYLMASIQKSMPVSQMLESVEGNGIMQNNFNANLKEKLSNSFEEKKLFLKQDLTIWDVCRETNSNRTYISNLINKEYSMNFNCFVNKHRVDYALKMIKNANHHDKSLDEIAHLSGFTCIASFNRAFKKFEGKSPGSIRNCNTKLF